MDLLVQLSRQVSIVQVVPVHQVLKQHVHEPWKKGRDASRAENQRLSQCLWPTGNSPTPHPSCLPYLCFPQHLTQGGRGVSLTKRDNDGTGDAVCHDHSEDTHHPRVSSPKLELVSLVLQEGTETQHNPGN